MIYTLSNIRELSKINNPVKTSYIIDSRKRTKWKTFVLEDEVIVELSNGVLLEIPAGFMWDKSSSPRIFWSLIPPFGNFEIAALIHDYIYVNCKDKFTRQFADLEMYKWSIAIQGTKKISWYNIDNTIRYYAVKWFGGSVWNS